MEAKRCGSCHKTKPVSEFHRKGDGYRDRCKECSREYHRQHYLQHRSRYIKLNRLRAQKYRSEMNELLAGLRSVPCPDCGKEYPYYVMDFDHARGRKLFSVVEGYSRRKFSRSKILEEIRKCDVVCSNCHRIRTHNRRVDNQGKKRHAPS